MQASVPPALIQNVRVSSIGLGDEAFKILSLRALPSSEDSDEGTDLEKKREQRELEGEDDPSMKYYNLEASFAYNAIPATGVIGKAKNLHLEVIFYLGVQGLFGVPLPIFVELNGIVGTIRLVRKTDIHMSFDIDSIALSTHSQSALSQEPHLYLYGITQD